MAFFYYNQNNPGSRTHNNDIVGSWVIVEHIDAKWANDFVQECTNGQVYFNGCEDRKDCRCCGDRWGSVDKDGIFGLGENGEDLYLPYSRVSRSGEPEKKPYLIEDILGKEVELFLGPYREDLIHVYMKCGEHRIYSQGKTPNILYVFNRQM